MSLEARRDVFQAIADPTRRQIIGLIAHKSMNLNSIADNFDISRPAISQHIKILTECGMIVVRQEGRERFCEAKLEKLNEVHEWVKQYHQLWAGRLNALKNFIEQEELQSNSENTTNKKKAKHINKSKK
jgi:DNA-binding transcriptional ArsR family regulator